MKQRIGSLLLFILLCGSGAAQPLTIYTEINAPLQMQREDGQLTGLAVEIVKEIQKRIGSTEPIQLVPWARGYLDLETLPNIVLFATARTAERDPLFNWVGPFDETVFSLYVKADSKTRLDNLEDARRLKTIGVYKNDVRDLYLTKAGFTNLERTIDNIANVKKLMSGRIDAFASASVSIEELTRSAGYQAGDVREALIFMRVQQFIAISKGTPDSTVKAWLQAFKAMKKDRTFEHLFRHYYPNRPLPGPTITSFPRQ
jgi:polar amino acid transport system substrate-binding protein